MYDENNDPVAYCIKALQTGKNKGQALEKAKAAYSHWWRISAVDEEIAFDDIENTLFLRLIVLATLATVFVWNESYSEAFDLESDFLYHEELWEEENRQVIEGYLSHLLFQNQFEQLELIFKNKKFQKEFLQFENIYQSVLNNDYELQGDKLEFVTLVNKTNKYYQLIKDSL